MGGHIEVGETAAQALKRELQEELGMSLRIGSFLGCVEYQFTLPPGSTKCHNQEFNFIFDVQVTPEEAAALACHEEHINIQWIEFSKLSSINLKPTGLDHYIAAWLNNTSSNAPRFITLIE